MCKVNLLRVERGMKKIILLALFLSVSGCYMVPLAFVGPATSGFTTASIVQSALTTTTNHVVKKTTGKSITEHALDSLNEEKLSLIDEQAVKINSILPKKKPLKTF